MARSPEKMESIKQKFGNLSEDKLTVVEGNVGEDMSILHIINISENQSCAVPA